MPRKHPEYQLQCLGCRKRTKTINYVLPPGWEGCTYEEITNYFIGAELCPDCVKLKPNIPSGKKLIVF